MSISQFKPGSCSATLLGIFLSLIFSTSSSAQVSVVSTVRPLQFISQAILLDDDVAYAIENDSHAAHSITLSPQDRIQIESADLVLWISEDFEIYLTDLLESSNAELTALKAADIAELTLHRMPNGDLDPHLWLDPNNALLIAKHLTAELVKLAPARAQSYESRLAAFQENLHAEWQRVEQEIATTSPKPYAVYHDAFRYIEIQLGLSPAVVLLDNPEVEPGMRDIIAKRQQLEATNPQCIFLEPEASQELVDTMLQQLTPQRVTMDILGSSIEEGDQAYLQLLNHVAEGFSNCISTD